MIRKLFHHIGIHPHLWWDAFLTYPRFIGVIVGRLMNGNEEEVQARLMAMNHRLQPSRLKTPVGKRLLVLSPHPDDESIGCGGLLLLHRARAEMHLVNLFSGDGCGLIRDLMCAGRTEEAAKAETAIRRALELDKVAEALALQSVTRFQWPDGCRSNLEQRAAKLRSCIIAIQPDVVILPWFLDRQGDHQMTNLLYAAACPDLNCMVLGCEIWSRTTPNAYLDITEVIDEKMRLIRHHETQVREVDYASLARNVAGMRGFELQNGGRRDGCAEAYLCMPNKDYCEVVRSLYGSPGDLSNLGKML